MNILMITIGYPPDQVGGTEVYVEGLVEQLQANGYECRVAYLQMVDDPQAPPVSVAVREHNGTPVHVVRANQAHVTLVTSEAQSAGRDAVLDAFEQVVEGVRPDVVHLHPLTLGLDSFLVERLKRRGLPVVVTFHSSTTGCARGDLVYLGREPCHGEIIPSRCAACWMHSKGMPHAVAAPLARLPLPVLRAAGAVAGVLPGGRRVRSLFRIPDMAAGIRRAWDRAMGRADAVVAVCRWVRDVTIRNGVAPEKILLSRHGLRFVASIEAVERSGPARFGYLGRVSPEKGIAVLVDALSGIPRDVPFEFEFCSATFAHPNPSPAERAMCDLARRAAAADPRVRILGSVPTAKLPEVLAGWDALVVPSLWFESGPQVVYESFAVKTPVIGSDRGGIAELVTHGKDGILVSPTDVTALRETVVRFARDPAPLRKMREQIGHVRTTRDLFEDMRGLYDRLLAGTAQPFAAPPP